MGINENIRNATASNFPLMRGDTNAPSAFSDRQKQYLAPETQAYFQKNLKYTSDFFSASCQGLDYTDFYAWTPVLVRLSEVVDVKSLTQISEDFKVCVFEDASIDYFGRGAKLISCGNTYINVNPANISAPTSTALLRKCNVIWHSLDYYGNIVAEPFCWAKPGSLATANTITDYNILLDAYQHCSIQYNAQTSWITENTRVILGNQAYAVQGIQNFSLEFSNDENTVHMINFDLYRTEVTENDDMTNRVADGKSFSWSINISGASSMNAGSVQTLTASSLRNGETPNSAYYPYSYTWASSDPNVATVDSNGLVTAVSSGNATITCALTQNASISATFPVSVAQAITTDHVAFTTIPDSPLEQYESTVCTAYFFDNGTQQSDAVSFTFAGANASSYGATISGNSVSIICYAADDTPLTITATCNGYSASTSVQLIGY